VGGSQSGASGTEWAGYLPLVLAGGAAAPLYVLFRILRARMETAHPARVRPG
jgi:hypothetical protein